MGAKFYNKAQVRWFSYLRHAYKSEKKYQTRDGAINNKEKINKKIRSII